MKNRGFRKSKLHSPSDKRNGIQVIEVYRKIGIVEQIFYRWKKKYQGRAIVELRRLRILEEENHK